MKDWSLEHNKKMQVDLKEVEDKIQILYETNRMSLFSY